jgi:signal transduction histidine kinase
MRKRRPWNDGANICVFPGEKAVREEDSSVTIRKAVLLSFFALVLGSIALVGALSFFQFRQALQSEIAHNLQFGASAVLQRIDAFFFERLENIRVWRHLEVMQDIRVEDVDKRLSRFLSDLRVGHGAVYQALLCTDNNDRVVAASDSAWIGKHKPVETAWIKVPGNDSTPMVLESLQTDKTIIVALRTTIPDAFGKGDLGYLYALLNWSEVTDLLDDAVTDSKRGALLLDADGRVIAASAALRRRKDIYSLRLGGWLENSTLSEAHIRDGTALGYTRLLVGSAASSGYQHFPGFGWHLLMVEPTDVAFAPIWRLLLAMVLLLILTLVVAGWISSRLAARIAQPIVSLTEFTRRFRKDEQVEPMRSTATFSEVGELNQAYADMIAALERSREQIVRAGKLAVVGEMAAVMAHEVRTPLGILRSSAQLLERQPDLGEKERELTGFIFSETDRLNRLVTMLLECASPRPPDFKPHELHDIIAHVLDLLAARAEHKHVRLLRQLAARHSILVGDREQLIQIVLNLVINALHFVPAGGRIVVATRNEGESLMVSVADDGPGIPAEQRPRVFDPFFTRREGGIGLGLTIVQQIVQVHHGEIWVTESEWGGACFNIRFDADNKTDRD